MTSIKPNADFAAFNDSLLKTDGKFDNWKVTGTTAAVAGVATLEILWLVNSPQTFIAAHIAAIIAAEIGYTIGSDRCSNFDDAFELGMQEAMARAKAKVEDDSK